MTNHGPFANPEEVSEISNKGERYVPLVYSYNAAMHLGHMASYKLALRYAYGRKVLDLGCGTGYGAREVVIELIVRIKPGMRGLSPPHYRCASRRSLSIPLFPISHFQHFKQ